MTRYQGQNYHTTCVSFSISKPILLFTTFETSLFLFNYFLAVTVVVCLFINKDYARQIIAARLL